MTRPAWTKGRREQGTVERDRKTVNACKQNKSTSLPLSQRPYAYLVDLFPQSPTACRTLCRHSQAGVKSAAWIRLGPGGRKREKGDLAIFSNLRPLPSPLYLFSPCPLCDATHVHGSDLHDGASTAAFPSRGSLRVRVPACVCMCVFSQALANRIPELMRMGRMPAGLELRQEPLE